MSLASIPLRTILVSASLFITTVVHTDAQAPTDRVPTAKDEAIPSLRDASIVALTHIRVIDGTGALVREDQTLVVGDGKILALGSSSQIKVPENARSLDLAGRTVLPGLVMLHEHLFLNEPGGSGSGAPSHPQHLSFPRMYLAYGVTTIRTAGTDFPYMDLNSK